MSITFTTGRLTLRPFEPSDTATLYDYLSDPNVLRWLPENVFDMDGCTEFITEKSQLDDWWAVCLNGQHIGHVMLHPVFNPAYRIRELGYVFNPVYHGRGYATEACRCLLRHGFETLGAHRVIATCDPENTASWRLMERLGMRREAHNIRCLFLREPQGDEPPDWRDEYTYAMLVEEWR